MSKKIYREGSISRISISTNEIATCQTLDWKSVTSQTGQSPVSED